jgi:hypothetical protein
MDVRPQTGDVVIWDVEQDETSPAYWVGIRDRNTAARLFEGPHAWTLAREAAEQLAGRDRAVWKRHKDGHFEKLTTP